MLFRYYIGLHNKVNTNDDCSPARPRPHPAHGAGRGCQRRRERPDLVSDAVRPWAGETLKNEIDYNFRRYADHMFSGTLQLIIHGTIPVMPPPRGSYVEWFSRLLALKRQPTPEAIGEIIAGLGDEDERIRWLAGSVLLALKAESVVTAVRAFAQRSESAEGRTSAQEWLRRVDA